MIDKFLWLSSPCFYDYNYNVVLGHVLNFLFIVQDSQQRFISRSYCTWKFSGIYLESIISFIFLISIFKYRYKSVRASQGALVLQRTYLPVQKIEEMWVQSLVQGDPLEDGMATHSSILVWRIPWTVEPHRRGHRSQTWLKQFSTHALPYKC